MSEKKPSRRLPIPLGQIKISNNPSSINPPSNPPPIMHSENLNEAKKATQKIIGLQGRMQLQRGVSIFRSKAASLPTDEQIALKNLRTQVMEAIKKTEHYWLLYKYGSYGIAGFLPLKIKKIYVEIVFFNPGHPNFPFILHSPNNSLIDFRNITSNFKDMLQFNPIDVIYYMENSVKSQMVTIQAALESELKKIYSDFIMLPFSHSNGTGSNVKSSQTENNYLLKLIYPIGCLNLLINLSKYPECPLITLYEKSIDRGTFLKYEQEIYNVIDTFFGTWEKWDENNPPVLHSRLVALEDSISHMFNISSALNRRTGNQIILENLAIGTDVRGISLNITRTQTLGIHAELPTSISKFFDTLRGKNTFFSGQISLFDCQVPECFSTSSIKQPLILDVSTYFTPKELTMATKTIIAKKGRYRNQVIEVFNLESLWNRRLKFCNQYDRLQIRLAQAFLQDPDLVLLSISENELNQLEIEHFLKVLKKIKYAFKGIIIITAPQEIISQCDQIISIGQDGYANTPGNMNELAAKMPQGGEIIIIELKSPLDDPQRVFGTIPNLQYIELRKGERFKIIAKESPDAILIQLLGLFGDKFYNYKRFKPTLQDYLDFVSTSQRTIKLSN